ncbi:MAG: TolC family protein [Bacteroidota bacterium]
MRSLSLYVERTEKGKLILLSILLLLGVNSYGQNKEIQQDSVKILQAVEPSDSTVMSELMKEDSARLVPFNPYKIAPLEDLVIRAWEYSAQLEYNGHLLEEQVANYKVEKKKWLQFITGRASMSYGTGSGLFASDNGTVVATQLTNQENLLYNTGVGITLSPEYWVNRKQNLRVMEARMAQVRSNKEIIKQELRGIVVERYVAYQNALKVLKVHAAAMESYAISHETAAIYFNKGDLNITEYNTSLQYKTSTELKYFKAKGEFQMALQMLKDICGGRID